MLAVYQRELPAWDAAQTALARQAAEDGTLWLLSSAESVANLQQLLPSQSWQKRERSLRTSESLPRQDTWDSEMSSNAGPLWRTWLRR